MIVKRFLGKKEKDLYSLLLGKLLPVKVPPTYLFTFLFGVLCILTFMLRINAKQPLSVGPEIYEYFTLFNVSTSLFPFLMNGIPILVMVMGVVTIFLFGSILRKMGVNKNIRFFALLFFAFSPIYVYVFTSLNTMGCVLFFTLLAFHLLFEKLPSKKNNKYYLYLFGPYFCFFIIAFLDNIAALLLIIFLLVYWKKGHYKSIHADRIKKCIGVGFTFFASFLVFRIFRSGYEFIDTLFVSEGLLKSAAKSHLLLTDFGALFGFSLFFLILCFLGILILWSQRKQYFWQGFIMLLFLLPYLYFNIQYVVLVMIFLIMLAAFAFNYLFHVPWKLAIIRDFCLLLLFLGCLFTITSFVFRAGLLEPQMALLDAAELLEVKYYQDVGSTLLTHPSYHPYLRTFTQFNVVEDEFSSNRMFHSRRLDTLLPLLEYHNIQYILITEEMRSGLVWEDTVQLLFLLEHSENFKKKFENCELEIWEYDEYGKKG